MLIDERRKRHVERAERMINLLAFSGQYGRAAKATNLLTGVFKSWQVQKTGGRFNKGKLKSKK